MVGEIGGRGYGFGSKSLSRRERADRVSGPGEGYPRNKEFREVPLTRRFAAPSNLRPLIVSPGKSKLSE